MKTVQILNSKILRIFFAVLAHHMIQNQYRQMPASSHLPVLILYRMAELFSLYHIFFTIEVFFYYDMINMLFKSKKAGENVMKSIVQAVFENSILFPDKNAIIYNDTAINYQKLTKKIKTFAFTLKSKKITKGSRIMIESDDLISYFCAFLGCQLYGCIAVPFEKNISIYKFQDIFKTAKPKLVFMKNNGEDYNDYLQLDKDISCDFIFPQSENICSIDSTTGTTGSPSFVTHTNRSIVATAENLSHGTNIDSHTVLFTNIPFDLASGYRRVMAVLLKGGTAVITHDFFSLEKIFYFNKKYHLSHLALISSDLSFLCKSENAKKMLDGIRYIESATGELPTGIITKFYQKFPEIVLYNVYGSTESGCVLINNTRENYSEDCLGKPSCNARICLIDENGDEITSPGKYGYVAVSGHMNMQGYYRKKDLTEQTMFGDKLLLSDIAYFDAKGYYYFVSRVGDIINVSGHKVTPMGVEKAALTYDKIVDCACVAKDDSRYGQIPILFVQYKKGCEEDTNLLIDYLKRKLEDYRIPKKVIPIKKIPRTATGKLMRKSLSLIEQHSPS